MTNTPQLAEQHYDVIIVGAGSAGCALASRLSENADRSVLLLEAGSYYGSIDKYPRPLRESISSAFSMPGSPDSWPLMAQLTEDVSFPVGRGKVAGGSSAVNGGLFMRGVPDDYDRWARAGNTEWSYSKVLPFFVRGETDLDFGRTDVHGATGPMPVLRQRQEALTPISEAFVEATLDMGHPWNTDVNGKASRGVGLVPHNTPLGVRQNAAVCYLEPVRARRNLTISAKTPVRRILLKGARAVGVEALLRGSPHNFFGDEVVLCAGGIMSPQLLMVSGIGPPNLLRALGIPVIHGSPYVGQNAMDHPSIYVPYRLGAYRPTMTDRPRAEVVLTDAVDNSDCGAIRLNPFTFTHMNMLFGVFAHQRVVERMRAAAFLTRPIRTVRGTWGMSLSALRQEVALRNCLMLLCQIGVEESRGEVTIVSKDPDVQPRIRLRYLTEPNDQMRLQEAVSLGIAILEHRAFQKLKVHRVDTDGRDLTSPSVLRKWMLQHLTTSFHTSCTCRMGPDEDATAVVDQYCRVRGVEGLRVVDLSVLPTIVSRPTNATALMVGERAAEFFDGQSGAVAD